jgi:hypothetical protein
VDVNQWIRAIAGLFILISVALGWFLSSYWLFFTVFVGVNLLQSGFTGWCPMMALLRRAGVRG